MERINNGSVVAKMCDLLPRETVSTFVIISGELGGSDRTATMAIFYTTVDDSGGSLVFRKLWAEYGGNWILSWGGGTDGSRMIVVCENVCGY